MANEIRLPTAVDVMEVQLAIANEKIRFKNEVIELLCTKLQKSLTNNQ